MRKRILLIGTGGTIASEPTESGLSPGLSAEELLRSTPGVRELCDVDCMGLLSLDSTNMTPDHWQIMVRAIKERYDDYDGFVLTHGTDTMAYTAAALSYMIQNGGKPVVLTGAQKPMAFDTTDSRENLYDAFLCAVNDMPGVSIVFDHKVIAGTRAKKKRTKSFAAFESIDYPELGVIRDGMLFRYITRPSGESPIFFEKLDKNVSLVKLIPGMGREVLDFMFSKNDAVIIESFGVGGLPEAGGFRDCISTWCARGRFAVLTTQVESEGSDLGIYRVGSRLKNDPGVLEAYDMTTEAVYSKLMWILAGTKDPARVREMFYTPVACDILRTAVLPG